MLGSHGNVCFILDSTIIYGRGTSNNAERAVDVVSRGRAQNPKRRDSRTSTIRSAAKYLAGSIFEGDLTFGGKMAPRAPLLTCPRPYNIHMHACMHA